MTKPQANNMHEARFLMEDFQDRWKKYQKAFGAEIDSLFGNDYVLKNRLAVGLDYLLQKRFYEAYHELRHLAVFCNTDVDKNIYAGLMRLCDNEEEMARAKVGDWVKQSRCGFCKILERTPKGAIVKEAFDFQGTYIKESQQKHHFQITHTDLRTYQFLGSNEQALIKKYFSDHPGEEASFLKQTQAMLAYRENLLAAGFQEAQHDFKQYHFYRFTTEKVAFIINLKDLGEFIQVVFGFTSVGDAATAAFIRDYGEDDDSIKLRYLVTIKTEADAALAADTVRTVWETYRNYTKDEILTFKKERQKQFLRTITDRLKPLGFRKKNSAWIRPLEGDFFLAFHAAKSQWTDVYYWEISIYFRTIDYPLCYHTRLAASGNWQLLSDAEWTHIMDSAIKDNLLPFIHTPLAELGNRSELWSGCCCSRKKCQTCWMAKNLWEAIEN